MYIYVQLPSLLDFTQPEVLMLSIRQSSQPKKGDLHRDFDRAPGGGGIFN